MEFEKVRDIIVETLGCDAEAVTPTASLADDLGADSLAAVELVMALEEAVGILAPAHELLDHREYQPEVPLDELPPGVLVARLAAAQERHGLLALQDLQLRGVDAADLHLSLHRCHLPSLALSPVWPRRGLPILGAFVGNPPG